MFRIDTLDGESRITIELAGELDSETCADLLTGFEQAIAVLGGRELVIDLAEVSLIDSTGMRAIIEIERSAGEQRIALALMPPPADVTELFQIPGITGRGGLTPRTDESSPAEPFLERIELALPREPDAPARARAEIRQAVARRLSDADGATATLLTSELVTNAVIHPSYAVGGSVGLRITVFADRIRVDVTDAGIGFDPASLPPARPLGTSGHGLLVVDGLSTRWGTRRCAIDEGEGFCVWFELDAAPAGKAAEAEGQFSTPSRSQQYSSRHSLASSTQRASESQGSTVSNA